MQNLVRLEALGESPSCMPSGNAKGAPGDLPLSPKQVQKAKKALFPRQLSSTISALKLVPTGVLHKTERAEMPQPKGKALRRPPPGARTPGAAW